MIEETGGWSVELVGGRWRGVKEWDPAGGDISGEAKRRKIVRFVSHRKPRPKQSNALNGKAWPGG